MGIRRKKDINQDKPKYTEVYIQKCLNGFFAFNSVKYNIDGLYVFSWESDKLLETKSGYIYEFEIKISKSDFKNDFKNKKDKHYILETCFNGEEKYLPSFYERFKEASKNQPMLTESVFAQRILARKTSTYKKPNYFYYAVPEDMIAPEEVPEYAGLVYVNKNGGLRIVKTAPSLHKTKYSDEELNLSEKFYYNMVNYREKMLKTTEANKLLKENINKELALKGQEYTYAELKEKFDHLNSWTSDSKELISRLEKDNTYNAKFIRGLLRKILELGGTRKEIAEIEEEIYEKIKNH